MGKKREKFLILLADFISINLVWLVYYYLRVESGLFEMLTEPVLFLSMIVVYFYWVVIFTFVGMYKTWFAASRFEELTTLFKASFFGIFILFFTILYDDIIHGVSQGNRSIILIYWGLFLVNVGIGRVLIRSLQRSLLIKGIGRKNVIMVGYNQKAQSMHDGIIEHRALGIDVVAYVAVKDENIGKEVNGVKVVDSVREITKVVEEYNAKELILALEKYEDDVLLQVLGECEDMDVKIKIIPDLYEVISGQAKTKQIYGFPLIDIMPQLMPEWEKKVKRILDLFVAFLLLVITAPATILTAIAIKIESRGPVFYKQERVGLNGSVFKIYKFRSMVQDAEKKSGPMWSVKNDPRITKVGAFIRKVRLDELPQMINVFKGEMSLVGPRPERPYFVEKLAEEIPLYKRRLKVRPGITGWAQVKHKYDESVEDVKTKLRYDLFYIENISIRNDLNILFRTVFVVLFGKGHFD